MKNLVNRILDALTFTAGGLMVSFVAGIFLLALEGTFSTGEASQLSLMKAGILREMTVFLGIIGALLGLIAGRAIFPATISRPICLLAAGWGFIGEGFLVRVLPGTTTLPLLSKELMVLGIITIVICFLDFTIKEGEKQ